MITIKIFSGNVKDNPNKKTLLIQMKSDAPEADCVTVGDYFKKWTNVDVLNNKPFKKLQWVVSYNDTALRDRFVALLCATFKVFAFPELPQSSALHASSPKVLLMSVKIDDTPVQLYDDLNFDEMAAWQARVVKPLEDEKDALTAALAEQQRAFATQSAQLSAMQIELDAHHTTLTAAQQEIEKQNNQITALQAASDEKDRQNEALKAQLQKEEADAQIQREVVANLKRELEAQVISLKAKDERLNSLSNEISVLQQDAVDKEDIIKKLQQQLIQKPSDETVQQLKAQLKLKKKEVETINEKLLDAMLEKTVLQAEQEKQAQNYQQKIEEFQTKLGQLQAKQESLRVPIVSTGSFSRSQAPPSKGESKSEIDGKESDAGSESESESESESGSGSESEAEAYPVAILSSSSSSTRQPELHDLKNATYNHADKRTLFSAIFYNKGSGTIKTLVWDFYEKVNGLLFDQLPANKRSKSRGAIIYGTAAIITFTKQIEKYKTKTTQLYKLLDKYGDTRLVNNESDVDKIHLLILIKYSLVLFNQELLACLNVLKRKKVFCSLLKNQTRVLCTLNAPWRRKNNPSRYFIINQREVLGFVLILADFIFREEMTEEMLIQTLLDYAKTQEQTSPMDRLHHLTKEIPLFLSNHRVEIDDYIKSCKAKKDPKMCVPKDVIDLDTCTVRKNLFPKNLENMQNNAPVYFEPTEIGYFSDTASAADEIMLPMPLSSSSSSSSSSATAQTASKRRSRTSAMHNPQQVVTLVKNKNGDLEIYDEQTHGPRDTVQLIKMSFHEYDCFLKAEEKNTPKSRKRKAPATVASNQHAQPPQKKPCASRIPNGPKFQTDLYKKTLTVDNTKSLGIQKTSYRKSGKYDAMQHRAAIAKRLYHYQDGTSCVNFGETLGNEYQLKIVRTPVEWQKIDPRWVGESHRLIDELFGAPSSGSHEDEKMMCEAVASRVVSLGSESESESESDSDSDSDSISEAEVTNDADLSVSDSSSSSSSSSSMAVALTDVPAAVIADPTTGNLSPRSLLEEQPHTCLENSPSRPHADLPRLASLGVPGGPDLFAPPASPPASAKLSSAEDADADTDAFIESLLANT